MNIAALKSFAPDVRNKLIEAVTRKLDFVLAAQTPDFRTTHARQVDSLSRRTQADRNGLIEQVAYTWFNRFAALRYLDAKGWHPFRTRVLTPANADETQPELLKLSRSGSLPDDLAKHTDRTRLDDLLDGRIPSTDPQGEVYRHLVLAACRCYHALLPTIFERLDDETELLLPDDLLTEHSVVQGFRTDITDEDCEEVEVLGWLYQFYISERKDQVMARKSAVPTADIPAVTQLFTPHWIVRYLVENSLGRLWLLNRPSSGLRAKMPYYIEGESEREVDSGQWVVGSEKKERQSAAAIHDSLPTTHLIITKPEDIRLLDPACGSGHMLTYAFDLLYAIYEEEGYAPSEIPAHILRNNLYGVDICPRAAQLAELALVFKAREKYRLFFRPENMVRPNITELRDVRFDEGELDGFVDTLKLDAFFEEKARDWIRDGSLLSRAKYFDSRSIAGELLRLLDSQNQLQSRLGKFGLDAGTEQATLEFLRAGHKLDKLAKSDFHWLANAAFRAFVESRDILALSDVLALGGLARQLYLHLFQQFEYAKNFGSLIQPRLLEPEIQETRAEIINLQSNVHDSKGQLLLRETYHKVLRVLEQAEALTQRYHVVVANPPYMGGGQMNPVLKRFVGELYPKAAGDCAACFALRNMELALSGGRIGMITFQTWMFVSSFSEFREHLLSIGTVSSFVHNGRGVWGPDFGSCAFCFIARPAADTPGVFVRLFEKNSMVQSNEQLVSKFLNRDASRTFVRNTSSFRRVPGVPMAYWISDALADTFAKNLAISSFGVAKTGLSSGDKSVFCREWSEVSYCRIKFDARDHRDFTDESENPGTWAPLVTGGPFRKWYGNLEEVILWSDGGKKVREFEGSTIRNPSYYFKSGITWSDVTISTISFRFVPDGMIICDVGPMAFFDDEALVFKALAWGNTLYTERISKALNPTVHFKTGDFHRIPAKFPDGLDRALPEECVKIARADWDNFETSWDFRDQPLLRPGLKGATLEASWRNWEAQSTAAICRMQELETENNRLFIAAYGLDGELQPEVPEAQITLARAEARRDMAAFLSYAVGCMMGRYSPDHPGLMLANAGDTLREFLEKVGKPLAELSFVPDEDGIVPVLDSKWFENDIVARTREFLRATFGEATLRENLRFIEESLGKDLRKYFLTEFYKDHLQTYKKRPIYWLVQSPRKGFSALIYLHRYTRDTMNLVLNRYLRKYLEKLHSSIAHQVQVETNAATARDKTAARKEADRLRKILAECEEWERQTLLPLAQARVELDLDDGVKVNYRKLGEALAPVPGLESKDD